MHYPIEDSHLKQPVKDDTLRRSRQMYHDAVKNREVVFLNKNIITVKKDNKSFSDEDDYEEVITETVKNVSLNVSAILELAHTNIGDVPYLLEAALLSSAHIRFHTGIETLLVHIIFSVNAANKICTTMRQPLCRWIKL